MSQSNPNVIPYPSKTPNITTIKPQYDPWVRASTRGRFDKFMHFLGYLPTWVMMDLQNLVLLQAGSWYLNSFRVCRHLFFCGVCFLLVGWKALLPHSRARCCNLEASLKVTAPIKVWVVLCPKLALHGTVSPPFAWCGTRISASCRRQQIMFACRPAAPNKSLYTLRLQQNTLLPAVRPASPNPITLEHQP